MIDQAHALRTLMQQRRESAGPVTLSSEPVQPAAVLGFTSAKGGVGKTTLALQAALQLARAGQKVCVWDVDGNAAHDLLTGFHHSWSLTHILTGARSAREVLTSGPEGIHFLLGSGIRNLTTALTDRSESLAAAIAEWQRRFDAIVLDLPPVGSEGVRALIEAAHATWLVCTPEPAAIAASYACIKHDPSLLPHLSLLVNRVSVPDVAFDVIDRLQQTTRMFLQQEWRAAGYIPHDTQLESAGLGAAESPAAGELHNLIAHWLDSVQESQMAPDSFLKRLLQPHDPPTVLAKTA
jgi:flagellar biosynthesis protein FlhG